MGNGLQNLFLYEILILNTMYKEYNFNLNNKYSFRKLKSSPIIFQESTSKLNLQLINAEKILKTNSIKIKQNSQKNNYIPNINKIINNYYCLNHKKNNHSFCIEKDIQKEKNKNNRYHSVEKNQRKSFKFKNSFIENIVKISKLKYYIENKNELLLSEEEFKQVYLKLKETVTKDKHPVKFPIAIILGGQPGSGKSNLYSIARQRFSNNIVELDCDAFRIFHPYYHQIKKFFEKDDAIKTNPFIFKVVDLLIEELSTEKYNLIIESSLNSPNSALNIGRNLPPKGYKVELQIMATSKYISWQGTIDRYNEEVKKGGSPRAVSKEFHDEVVENICNSLDVVKKSGLMSNIIIYDRNKACLYNMKKDKNINPCLLLYCIINDFLEKYEKIFMILYNKVINIINYNI